MALPSDIANRFAFHPANDITRPRHEAVREVITQAADELLQLTKPSREQSLGLTALQEAMMWFNADIACNTPPTPAPPQELS